MSTSRFAEVNRLPRRALSRPFCGERLSYEELLCPADYPLGCPRDRDIELCAERHIQITVTDGPLMRLRTRRTLAIPRRTAPLPVTSAGDGFCEAHG